MSKRNGAPKSGTRRFNEAHKLPGGRIRPWGNSRPTTPTISVFKLPTGTLEVYPMPINAPAPRPNLFSRLLGGVARLAAGFLSMFALMANLPAIMPESESESTADSFVDIDEAAIDADNDDLANAVGAPLQNVEFEVSLLEA